MEKLLEQRAKWEADRRIFYDCLGQAPEEPLEPELEIVDTHHHLWDMRQLSGYNLFGIFKQQYYMTDEMVDDFVGCGHNVTQSVYVTAHSFNAADGDEVMKPLGEVMAVQGIAAQFASGTYGACRACTGIVGNADLGKYGAEVEPLLAACTASSPNYRGIRCSGAHDPNVEGAPTVKEPHAYSQPKFREGFALLQKYNLTFDAWLFSSQLPDVYELAQAYPGTTIVLNHLGQPVAGLGNFEKAPTYDGKQAEILARWREEMTKIARDCPNVYVKVGGNGSPWTGIGYERRDKPPSSEEVADAYKETFLWTIEAFGAARCMVESNFPVDKVGMSYTVLWNAFKRITKDLPAEDRTLLFSGTAKKAYQL